jgi:FtsZ-binding cell division protein ZapB
MERECNNAVREVTQLRSQNDRLKAEKSSLEQELFETQQTLTELQREFHKVQESNKREQDQVRQVIFASMCLKIKFIAVLVVLQC